MTKQVEVKQIKMKDGEGTDDKTEVMSNTVAHTTHCRTLPTVAPLSGGGSRPASLGAPPATWTSLVAFSQPAVVTGQLGRWLEKQQNYWSYKN